MAQQADLNANKRYSGHGSSQLFHVPPNIPRYARPKAIAEIRNEAEKDRSTKPHRRYPRLKRWLTKEFPMKTIGRTGKDYDLCAARNNDRPFDRGMSTAGQQ
ncbi:hypothetical protein PSTG_15337 [Puccinia striiformis f. sp. tritici PST-78]|uniref:Uncharacterized protein n=1 Tax=Puccinia striiformis f. sp. tritici PST-78 TaxID=1165861 RepID=A0A0L0UW41_9BASI|nr:hypothetical protein PSTG_15337 [Puccinia striiformis f. sp. tritici PST-78]